MRICPKCKIRPAKKHWNAKWCKPCAAELRRRPAGKLTRAQEQTVRRLAGTLYIHELAARVGTTKVNLTRWARDRDVNLNALKYPDTVIREVCDYYALHGRTKTQERFPNVRVRSIVERYYQNPPRQVRWSAQQLRELVQMAGLVSFPSQAQYFHRPNANQGAIKSAWVKRFRQGAGSINGLSWGKARHLVGPRCVPIRTAYWKTRHSLTHDPMSRRLVLWTDMERHLKPGTPGWIQDAVAALARFQRWVHGVQYVRPKVLRLIEEREASAKRTAAL